MPPLISLEIQFYVNEIWGQQNRKYYYQGSGIQFPISSSGKMTLVVANNAQFIILIIKNDFRTLILPGPIRSTYNSYPGRKHITLENN